jgi:hypothetical protein
MDEPAADRAKQLREMLDEGLIAVVGSAYPAQAGDPDVTALVEQHGLEFGPWQLNERGDKTDGPWSWLLVAVRPDVRAAITRDDPQS